MIHRWHSRNLCWATCALLLLSPLACASPAPSPSALESPASLAQQGANDLSALRTADIVYLGERHDSAADHAAQLEIITALQADYGQMAIALEMFQRPFQPVLDRYLAGEISEADLIEQTEYNQRWGFPWDYYAPILRLAQEQQWPVLALNAPAEITRQVARAGLDSLEGDDFRYIPDRADIDLGNDAYREFVEAAFSGHSAHGNLNLEHFFAAQVVWDETMAATIADFRQTHPQIPVVVLAGQGHVIYGYGIPDRVARRLGPDLNQQIVLINPTPDLGTDPEIADVFWYRGADGSDD